MTLRYFLIPLTIIQSFLSYLIWRFTSANSRIVGHLDCSDTCIYYEIHGSGKPLLLLHGGLTSVESWYAQLPMLAKDFKLIIIDMRGHGRSKMGQQAFTYDLLASDTLSVLEHLQLKKVDILGWSDGGIVGLKLAINHPEHVNRLIAISANYNHDGLTSDAINTMKNATPSNHSLLARLIYCLVAPEPNQWKTLWHHVTMMWASYPQIKQEDLAQIKAETLLIQGEKDLISEQHFNEMAKAIPNSQQKVIPNTGHNALQHAPEIINKAIHSFLM